MAEVRFYHLTSTSLENALPSLLEKVVQRNWQALIFTTSREKVSELDTHLWTYKPNSFLPHGTINEQDFQAQPILLTHKDEKPNDANILFLINGAKSQHVGLFRLCCLLFDGNNSGELNYAREEWLSLKNEGHELTYWHQDPQGKWSEKRSLDT